VIIKPADCAEEIAGALLVALHGHRDKLRQIAELLLAAQEPKPRPALNKVFDEQAAKAAERECRTCREPFVLRASTQMFCSPGCQQAGAAARCAVAGCGGAIVAKGFCEKHQPAAPPTPVVASPTPVVATKTALPDRKCARCDKRFTPSSHRQQYCTVECRGKMRLETAPKCTVAGCERPGISRGMCGNHYQQRRYALKALAAKWSKPSPAGRRATTR
jgi:hypothetical protein